ncbi:hypothetical protein J4H86_08630 [Spiractinospora alimapuensis]|uniref:hypothetical protein n=1 Tax=Spiractinospora alimapuensis TaxID=2820884 RepID=UPI001F3FC74B|nr:hypothetical protein [Spiractinospora alimapuensis]QVQ53765.1 hypothetical protein J4H86_08630 [Spiractinospora alimapuensis]
MSPSALIAGRALEVESSPQPRRDAAPMPHTARATKAPVPFDPGEAPPTPTPADTNEDEDA